jgi:hypothetical protein
LSNELPDTRILKGEQAIEALNTYAQELETQTGDDLTSQQRTLLIKTAKILSQTIYLSQESNRKENQNNSN